MFLVVETIIQAIHMHLRIFSPAELDPNCRRNANEPSDLFKSFYFSFLWVFSVLVSSIWCLILFYLYRQLKGFKARFGVNLELRNVLILMILFQSAYFAVCAFPFSEISDLVYKLVEEGHAIGIVAFTTLMPVLAANKQESES